MKKINFALIGAGDIAQTHIAALNSLKEINLVGVLSLNDYKKSFSLANQFGIRSYKTFKEVLDDKNIEAVDIIAKHDLHAKLGIRAANYGKHVLVEKPIATTLEDADQMIKACRENKVKLSVISQNRFATPYINLKKNIDKNKFGKMNLAVFSWIIYRDRNYFSSSSWRRSKKQAGGGFLIMNAIHYIDLLQWYLGSVFSVYGGIAKIKHKTEVEDTAYAVLKFKNNSKGIIYGTTAAPFSLPPEIEFYGTKNIVKIRDDNYMINSKEIFAKQIRDFALSVINNKKPLIDGFEGRKSLEIVLSIYKSAKLKKEIIFS